MAVLLIALVYAELGPMFPKSGALVHMSHISHGTLVGRIWSWILILTYVTIAPVEAMAVLNYANNYLPGMVDPVTSVLTVRGFVLAILLLGLMVGLNFLVIRLVLSLNSIATWWKLFVPAGTVVVLLSLSFHPENLASAPPKNAIEGIFTAVSTAGVFFSLFGFRQAIELAGETPNPGKYLPIAIIGTLLLGTILYLALQIAFLLAIEPHDLAKGGWAALQLPGMTGPFAALASAVGAAWWSVVLYSDAIVSPGACGFIWTTTTSRVLMATGETGDLPRVFGQVNRYGVPWAALLVSFLLGALFFFPFPSWQKLVGYISSITVLSYGLGPIILLRLRLSMPDAERPFRLAGAWMIAPLAFIAANLIILWAGFQTADFLFLLLAAIFVIYAIYYFAIRRGEARNFGWQTAWWLLPYFGGMWLISALGPAELGGERVLGFGSAMAAVVVLSLAILALALTTARPDEEIRETAAEIATMTQ